mgnify:CR=1 FL=1
MKNLILIYLLILPAISVAYTLGPTTPGKWGEATMGTGATITYSFQDAGTCDAGVLCQGLGSFMPVGFKTEIERAFDAWSAVANLTFFEVADDGANFNATTTSGDIRITGHVFDGVSNVLAHGFFPPNNGSTAAGDMHFDVAENWALSLADPGISIFQVMAHELGHALGLGHTDVAGSLMNSLYTEAFEGPQADDVAGIQAIYGAAVSAVPIPATVWLFALGMFGLIGMRKKVDS